MAGLLYQYSQRLGQFVLNSQLNTLPSPDNLRRWNANKDAICGLCTQKHATLCHILAGCPWVRGAENKLAHREDRYTWRHNNVLLAIARAVEERITEANAKAKPKEAKQLAPLQSAFVRAAKLLTRRRKSQRKMHHIYCKQRMIGNETLIYLSFALLALPMFFLMLWP